MRREKELRALLEAARSGDGLDAALQRAATFIDEVDAAILYATRLPPGGILGLAPGQRLGRSGVTARLSERADRDPDFRRAFRDNPRAMSALAAQEGMGISAVGYLWQVREVTLVEERPGLHYLVLPECHHGCESVPAAECSRSAGACQVCGLPRGPGDQCQADVTTTVQEKIRRVDDSIVRAAQADPHLRSRLASDSYGSFADETRRIWGLHPTALGVEEVKVVTDTETSVFAILRANHVPNPQVVRPLIPLQSVSG